MDPETQILNFIKAHGATPYPAIQIWWNALPHDEDAAVKLTLDIFIYSLLCEGLIACVQDQDPTIFLAIDPGPRKG